MLGIAAKWALSSAAALVLAGRSARILLRRTPARMRIGPWNLDLTMSSQSATMYQRARDARSAPYALPAPEAIYFAAFTDSAGQVLLRERTYRIEGVDLDARWWSLTAYCANQLIPNPQNRYSFTKTTVTRIQDAGWSIVFSPEKQPGDWLPGSKTDGIVKLVLRCYSPGPELLKNPGSAPLPRIHKETAP